MKFDNCYMEAEAFGASRGRGEYFEDSSVHLTAKQNPLDPDHVLDEQIKKYFHIMSLIDNTISQYVKELSLDVSSINKDLATQIVNINYSKIGAEFTTSNDIKIKLLLRDNCVLTLTKPYSYVEGMENDDVVYALFVNRKLVVNNVGNISTALEEIKKYL